MTGQSYDDSNIMSRDNLNLSINSNMNRGNQETFKKVKFHHFFDIMSIKI